MTCAAKAPVLLNNTGRVNRRNTILIHPTNKQQESYFMRYLSTAFFTLLAPCAAMAASTVAELNVSGDVATFTLSEPKTHAVPSCVNSDKQNHWAINLNSLQGQAMYSLLVTAVSKEQLVSVQSAGRCEAIADVEQVQSLSLSTNSNKSTGSGGAWLYKGDGVTKVGKILSAANNTYYYSPVEGTKTIVFYSPSTTENFSSLYFLDPECKVDPYKDYYGYPVLSYFKNVGEYFTFSDLNSEANRLSSHGSKPVYIIQNNSCIRNQSYIAQDHNRAVKLEKTEHPLCGKTPCWIK